MEKWEDVSFVERMHYQYPWLTTLLIIATVIGVIFLVIWSHVPRKERNKAVKANVGRRTLTVFYLDKDDKVAEGHCIIKGQHYHLEGETYINTDVDRLVENWFHDSKKRGFVGVNAAGARYVPWDRIREIRRGPREDFTLDGNGDEVK